MIENTSFMKLMEDMGFRLVDPEKEWGPFPADEPHSCGHEGCTKPALWSRVDDYRCGEHVDG